MLTKTELITTIVHAQVADAQQRDQAAKKGYGDRIRKAGDIVLNDGVKPLGNGEYEVRSQTDPTQVYICNGSCKCQDAVKGEKQVKGGAPAGFCKHRMATVIWKRVQEHLVEHVRICPPHPHRWNCTAHRDLEISCWQRVCPDPTNVICPTCAGETPFPDENPNVPAYVEHIIVDEGAPTQDFTIDPEPEEKPTMMSSIGSVIAKVFQGETPEPEPCGEKHPGMTCEEYESGQPQRELTTDQYEEAPVIRPKVDPLPEAPVSMCLTIKLPENHTITYTMRGHDDSAVLNRLPNVLATLEHVLKSEVDHSANFFQRLAYAFFPKKIYASK